MRRLRYHAELFRDPQQGPCPDRVRWLPIPTELGVSFVYLFNSKK